MLSAVITTLFLVAVTVAIHAAGLSLVLGALTRWQIEPPSQYWSTTWLLIRVTWSLLLIHLSQIAFWALFYHWAGCLPDLESAFYFSGVTYATIGYGDVVLPYRWRILGPVEGLVGILMCGLSAGLFFAFVMKVYTAKRK